MTSVGEALLNFLISLLVFFDLDLEYFPNAACVFFPTLDLGFMRCELFVALKMTPHLLHALWNTSIPTTNI